MKSGLHTQQYWWKRKLVTQDQVMVSPPCLQEGQPRLFTYSLPCRRRLGPLITECRVSQGHDHIRRAARRSAVCPFLCVCRAFLYNNFKPELFCIVLLKFVSYKQPVNKYCYLYYWKIRCVSTDGFFRLEEPIHTLKLFIIKRSSTLWMFS